MTILTTHKGITYTGGNSASLPLLLHGTGVAGVNHRWVTKAQTATSGKLATFTPSVGTMALTADNDGPTIATDNYGQKILRFDGTDDSMSNTFTDVQTVALVARVQAATGTEQGILNIQAGYLSRGGGADNVRVVFPGPGSSFHNGHPVDGPTYHLIVLAGDGTNGRWSVDGSGGDVTGTNSAPGTVRIGRVGASPYGQIDVLEAITWPTMLSHGQIGTVRDALKAHYGSAIA